MAVSQPADEGRVREALQSAELAKKLSLSDIETAQQVVSSALAEIDPSLRLVNVAQQGEGDKREYVVKWQETADAEPYEAVIAVPGGE